VSADQRRWAAVRRAVPAQRSVTDRSSQLVSRRRFRKRDLFVSLIIRAVRSSRFPREFIFGRIRRGGFVS
jgi:hypothetical protein